MYVADLYLIMKQAKVILMNKQLYMHNLSL